MPRLRLFPEAPTPHNGGSSRSSGSGRGAAAAPLHDVRASLATVQALGCGAFGHVRLRSAAVAVAGSQHEAAAAAGDDAPPPPQRFLPARLVPCPELSDERERGVLLAADEGVLAALDVALGGHVEVEAAVVSDPTPTPDPQACITLTPFDGAISPPPQLPPTVLNRAARGLVLAPGALLLVTHLGQMYALQVVETTAAGAGEVVVVVGPSTEVRLHRGGAQGKARGAWTVGPDGGLADIYESVLEEAVALLKASSEAATDPVASGLRALRMRGLLLSGAQGAGKTQWLRRLVRRLEQEGMWVVYVRGEEVRSALLAGGDGEEEDVEKAAGGAAPVAARLAQQLGVGAGTGAEALATAPVTVLVLDNADALLLGEDEEGGGGGGEAAEDEDDQGGAASQGRNAALRALRRYLMGDGEEGPGMGGGGGPCCCWVLATRGSVGKGGSAAGGGGGGGGGGRLLARRLAALQGTGLFDRALDLPPLSEQERASVLRTLLLRPQWVGGQSLKEDEDEEEDEEEDEDEDEDEEEDGGDALVARVAEATGGFLPGDLERLCRAAAFLALARQSPHQQEASWPPRLRWADFAEARREVGPAALGRLLQAGRVWQQKQQQQQQSRQEGEGAGVSWASVGGYAAVKGRLRQLIEWPLRYAATFERMGLGPAPGAGAGAGGRTPGILLHGPSGCGKSLLARVLAAEAKANFVELPATEVFSPFLGDSEARLRAAFARARRASPCILFLDELDAMAAGREGLTAADGGSSSSSGGVYARVLSTLLNEMDGVSTEAGGGGLVVLAATNRVEAVDAALLRPGRLQEAILVPLPTPEQDYLPILQVATARMPLAADVDLAALVRERLAPLAAAGTAAGGAVSITPATLGALAREAALVCLREAVGGAEEGEEGLEVTARHFDRAVDKVFCCM
jgi:SpoVK/Ycf46/Vps4 family AAA+-type ATPase